MGEPSGCIYAVPTTWSGAGSESRGCTQTAFQDLQKAGETLWKFHVLRNASFSQLVFRNLQQPQVSGTFSHQQRAG